MRYYLVNPVLKEIEERVIDLYEQKKLSHEQAIMVLSIIRESMEQYNLENTRQSANRCGKCLKVLEPDMPVYFLEPEINEITGGTWWNDEIEQEIAFDGLCRECCDLMIRKYLGRGAENNM